MIRPIMKDPIFLAQKSADASPEDADIGRDLLDTLAHHADGCVGMAANMIGRAKRIIVFTGDDGKNVLMYNPEILRASGRYEAEEGCLSLNGTRKALRWKSIKVSYLNEEFRPQIKTFSGFTAQIIQHEIDHCMGVLI